MNPELSRRQWLTTAAVSAVLTGGLPAPQAAAAGKAPQEPFRYALNTITIRGQKLSVVEEVDVTAHAGYDAIELWIDKLEEYARKGNSLKDLGKRIHDKGLTVESAIGPAQWIVDDKATRERGLEDMRRAMDTLQQLGGKRIAAPPAGAVEQDDLNLLKAAERYRDLLELGARMGIVPMLEFWGFSRSLSRLGEAALVALESGHPQACILADVFHLYKGGSGFTGLARLNPQALPVLHVNDYPSRPLRAEIVGSACVYPGLGVAPLKQLIRDLRASGFHSVLSLELFNKDYYKEDALQVARTGLQKMKAVVESSRGE